MYEFIAENESSYLQISDIDNLIYINNFFSNLANNKNIKSDVKLLEIFKEEFEKDKQISNRFNLYLKSYGEIIQAYQSYNENPEMNIEKINNILKDSSINFYKDEKLNSYIFKILYKRIGKIYSEINIKELDELKKRIMISSSNENIFNKKGEIFSHKTKTEKISDFISLFDILMELNKILNSLLKSGYFHLKKL